MEDQKQSKVNFHKTSKTTWIILGVLVVLIILAVIFLGKGGKKEESGDVNVGGEATASAAAPASTATSST